MKHLTKQENIQNSLETNTLGEGLEEGSGFE